jgi:hypothetical protein
MRYAILLVPLLALLVACGEDEVEPTPSPSPVVARSSPRPELTPTPTTERSTLESAVAEIDAALRAGDIDFFVQRAAVTTITCPQELPAFDECLPGDSGPVEVRRQCKFGSDCGLFQEASYRQRLQEQLASADLSQPTDAYGEPGWRVYAYMEPQGTDPRTGQQVPSGAIATAIVEATDGQVFRQVMFIAVEEKDGSWFIPAITIGAVDVNGVPAGLAPDDSYYPARYWHWKGSGAAQPEAKLCAPLTARCRAIVTGVGPNKLKVRSAPGTAADEVAQLSENDIVCVTGLPTEADGFRWWPIIAPDGIEGWAAEGDPQPAKPWLTPIGENC